MLVPLSHFLKDAVASLNEHSIRMSSKKEEQIHILLELRGIHMLVSA
jgi:hypothetical protein